MVSISVDSAARRPISQFRRLVRTEFRSFGTAAIAEAPNAPVAAAATTSTAAAVTARVQVTTQHGSGVGRRGRQSVGRHCLARRARAASEGWLGEIRAEPGVVPLPPFRLVAVVASGVSWLRAEVM